MEPSNSDQLQGKRNARAWKRQFKVAALGKGVWDVFNGIYTAVTCPDPKDYGLENAQENATKLTNDQKDDKGKRKARTTLGPEEINDFIQQAALSAADQKKGLDFGSRMTLYKFTLDEYDKGRKTIAIAMALLITWVHSSLRGQLESFDDPKKAYDHLITRYSVTDARAREMAENQFNGIYVTRFSSAQDYINAIENAKQDILEAGGYCDDAMMISKIIRGLRGHPMYKDFATQYHLLRDIDTKFEDLDHVITQLLTFESSNFPEPDFRSSGNRSLNGFQGPRYSSATGNRFVNRPGPGMRGPKREQCNACGIWGHNENRCFRANPDQRPGNNGYAGRSGNATNGFGNNVNRGTKPKGMAAAVFVDNSDFVTALNNARTKSVSSLPKPESTISHILTQETPAKDSFQATSLEWVGRKGELSRMKDFCLEGEGVRELHAENFVFNNKCPMSQSLVFNNKHSFSEDSQSITMHNNNNSAFMSPDQTKVGPRRIFPSTISDSSVLMDPWTILDVEDAFIQVPFHDSDTEFDGIQPLEWNHEIDSQAPSHDSDAEPVRIQPVDWDHEVKSELQELQRIQDICLATSTVPVDPNSWILDSGANIYICNNAAWFTTLYTFDTTVSTAGQGSAMHIVGGGTVILDLEDNDGDVFKLTLNDVAYAPTSRCNLISISKLAQAGVHGSWDSRANNMELRTVDDYIIGHAVLEGGLYHLQLATTATKVLSSQDPFVANIDFTDDVWKEHRRLGHLSLQRMIQLCSQSVGMNVTKGQIQAKLGQICPVCATTRAIVRMPRDPAKIRYDEKGQLVHVDIWGPYPVKGWDGTRWMIFSTDDATRATKTLRLKTLTEFPKLLRELHKKEERKYQIVILRYRVDNQFNQGPWKDWCKKKGITIDPIAPHAHHQVGVAERVNRTLREGASAMIQDNAIGRQIRRIIEERGNEFLRNSTLPEALWPEAVDYAAWLKNRTPTRALKSKKTPWEMEEGRAPDLSRERTWGSRVYVSYTEEERGRKLHDPRGWLGYFVGCENESTYRVWDPATEKVKRVAYTVVEDGQGLDDTHIGQNVNDRVIRQPLEQFDEDSPEVSENEDETEHDDDRTNRLTSQSSSDEGARSRFFPRPAAMVTTRSEPRARKNSPVERLPLLTEDDSPIGPYEDTYVPPIGQTLQEGTSSPYFGTDKNQSIGQNEKDSASDLSEHDDEEFGDFQSSNIGEGESFQQLDPDPMFEDEPDVDQTPIPTRSSGLRTANQMPISSETEDDVDAKIRCANDFCATPRSTARQSQLGPDGNSLCENCYRRYKKNPSNWQKGRKFYQTQGPQGCGNDLCTTPNSYVGPAQLGPHSELLCKHCHERYKAQINSQLPRDADSWRTPEGGRSRKGMVMRKTKAKEVSEQLDTSDSNDDVVHTKKRDETRRGTKLKKRVPDENKCQPCFDYDLNCDGADNNQCTQCKRIGRICQPVKLNPDGTLPAQRRFCKTPVHQNQGPSWEDRCYTCRKRNRKCDATLPIDPKNPCTSCKTINSYCCSMEQHQRMEDSPPCLRCKNKGKSTRCNRLEPCDICVDVSHARCTYETDNGARWLTTLTNPIPPEQRKSKQDPNADYYIDYDENPGMGRPGCTMCQAFYAKGSQGKPCSFQQGGPPCEHCIQRVAYSPGANRCTNWVAPGKIDSVATNMFRIDDLTGEIVRKVDKTDNLRPTKRARPNTTIENMSTSESSSDEGNKRSRAKKVTEESRMAAREKLMSVKLSETFMAALSLTALQTPVDNALRPDPQSYTEAIKSPDSRLWREAIQAEYDSLMENGTWKIAVLPPGRKALTTKWVLKKKLGPNGEVVKYKARMVARGFQQVEGYDYTETYSGVVKAAAYRLLFALMVLNGWTCHQMDVATAFLNGDVLEEIYIHPPQGYPHPGKVLRLLKALYGLKQSPRLWYRKLKQWLLQNGWEISKYDECVFYNTARQLIITVYVDDINIFGPSDEPIISFKAEIAGAFKMTDAGRASWYLGMQLVWLANGLHIHQNGFIQQALARYGLLGSKAANIPLDPGRKLLKETENTADPKFKTTYMSMVGSLNYLQTKTVWGLAFPVSLVSRFMTNPNQTHMDAVLQEFRYLVGTSERGLFFRGDGDPTLRGFVDSDWGGDTETGKSTTGWVFTLAGCPVSWCSQRQKTVSSSSTEAEYIAASDACKEAIWLKGFHNEIAPKMNHPEQTTIPLAIDNASALKLTKNPEFHGRTKHINIRHHFIRECVERREIVPEWISGKVNPADLFTKPLPKTLFLENVSRLGGGLPVSSTSDEASKVPEDVTNLCLRGSSEVFGARGSVER